MQSDEELINYIRKRVTLQDPNIDEIQKEVSGQNHTFFKMLQDTVNMQIGGPINKIKTYTLLCD